MLEVSLPFSCGQIQQIPPHHTYQCRSQAAHLSPDLYRNIFLAGDDAGDANPRPCSPPPPPLSGDAGATGTPSSSARSSWWYRTLPSCGAYQTQVGGHNASETLMTAFAQPAAYGEGPQSRLHHDSCHWIASDGPMI